MKTLQPLAFQRVASRQRITLFSYSKPSGRADISRVSITGCSTSPSGSVGAYIDDTVITTKVKAKFADANQVDATSINVETISGTVLLRGVAKTRQKAQAETIARSVDGVKAVNNRIDVSS